MIIFKYILIYEMDLIFFTINYQTKKKKRKKSFNASSALFQKFSEVFHVELLHVAFYHSKPWLYMTPYFSFERRIIYKFWFNKLFIHSIKRNQFSLQ